MCRGKAHTFGICALPPHPQDCDTSVLDFENIEAQRSTDPSTVHCAMQSSSACSTTILPVYCTYDHVEDAGMYRAQKLVPLPRVPPPLQPLGHRIPHHPERSRLTSNFQRVKYM